MELKDFKIEEGKSNLENIKKEIEIVLESIEIEYNEAKSKNSIDIQKYDHIVAYCCYLKDLVDKFFKDYVKFQTRISKLKRLNGENDTLCNEAYILKEKIEQQKKIVEYEILGLEKHKH